MARITFMDSIKGYMLQTILKHVAVAVLYCSFQRSITLERIKKALLFFVSPLLLYLLRDEANIWIITMIVMYDAL